tara:strand:- start:30 stop:557 length:528 start_codon:yes stop_codon:yes gene_type:complete
MTARKNLVVTWQDELYLADRLRDRLLSDGLHAGNTVIITVSTDYSSFIGQYLRHQLSHDGEICDGFGVDVPYPDQTFDDVFRANIRAMFAMHAADTNGKTILLVEAGVIRGGNYATLVDLIRNDIGRVDPIATLALYENVGSRFRSDYVGRYYDDATEDLTFWWERPNNHWRRNE